MLERDGYPPGVPCWIDTLQPDPEAAARFYGGLFGWQFEDVRPGDGQAYLVGRLDGRDVAAVGSLPEDGPLAWNTYVWVESADEAAERAGAAGGSVIDAPFDVGEAGRMAVLSDPTGAVFSVWQARGHRGAQVVNAAGTWNWSDLKTRDAEAARAFYGELFGWQAADVGFGEMLRLPGYGEFLERRDPDLRRRHSEAGAPPGFSDAVAWLLPTTGDDMPSHWSVTFSVDDADATATRARELGGEVTVPPFDAGPTRVAILRDPQGAAFSVSKYDPDL